MNYKLDNSTINDIKFLDFDNGDLVAKRIAYNKQRPKSVI